MHPLHLEGKWRIQAYGRSLVLPKRAGEKASHVWLKGLLWFLYVPSFPHLMVERSVGHRFKPDLVAFATEAASFPQESPVFWGECGQVALDKLERLLRQFPGCHFAVAKWGAPAPWERLLDQIVLGRRRQAPVDLLFFPEDTLERYLGEDGRIELALNDVLVRRWPGRAKSTS